MVGLSTYLLRQRQRHREFLRVSSSRFGNAFGAHFHNTTDTKGLRSEHHCCFGPEWGHDYAFRASRGDSTPKYQFYLRRGGTRPGGDI